jgi:hypothetical protein
MGKSTPHASMLFRNRGALIPFGACYASHEIGCSDALVNFLYLERSTSKVAELLFRFQKEPPLGSELFAAPGHTSNKLEMGHHCEDMITRTSGFGYRAVHTEVVPRTDESISKISFFNM